MTDPVMEFEPAVHAAVAICEPFEEPRSVLCHDRWQSAAGVNRKMRITVAPRPYTP